MYRTAAPSFITAVALTIAACATAPRVDRASDETAIRALERQMEASMNAKDVNAVTNMYTSDATLLPPNVPAANGSAAIRAAWTEMTKVPKYHLTLTPARIDVSKAGDMATEVGTYTYTADMPDSHVDDVGKYVVGWKKVDGQWKMAADTYNSDKPIPAPPVAVVVVESDQAQMQPSAGMQWSDFQVPGFAPGVKMAVLHGDPSKSGDYTVRLRFPDNYTVPPHWHPGGEHVTVLQGSFSFGMGNTFDRSALKTYGPGDFVFAPAKMAHFAQSKGETIVQLHGDGPFAINLVKP